MRMVQNKGIAINVCVHPIMVTCSHNASTSVMSHDKLAASVKLHLHELYCSS